MFVVKNTSILCMVSGAISFIHLKESVDTSLDRDRCKGDTLVRKFRLLKTHLQGDQTPWKMLWHKISQLLKH